MKLLILIIFINHFIACAWFMATWHELKLVDFKLEVGCNPPGGGTSWLRVAVSKEDLRLCEPG